MRSGCRNPYTTHPNLDIFWMYCICIIRSMPLSYFADIKDLQFTLAAPLGTAFPLQFLFFSWFWPPPWRGLQRHSRKLHPQRPSQKTKTSSCAPSQAWSLFHLQGLQRWWVQRSQKLLQSESHKLSCEQLVGFLRNRYPYLWPSLWQLFVCHADRYSTTKLLLYKNLAFSLTVRLLRTPRLWQKSVRARALSFAKTK